MMSTTRSFLLALTAAAAAGGCVKGSPLDDDPLPPLEGGRVTPAGCAYESVTGLGAEAPALGADERGLDPSVRLVHLGFIGDPRTSMVVSWRTRDDVTTAGRVRYGQDGVLDHEAPGYTFRYQTGLGGVGEILVRVHEAHLCGLEPDTAYDYQVVSDDNHVSPVYRFRTAPDFLQYKGIPRRCIVTWLASVSWRSSRRSCRWRLHLQRSRNAQRSRVP